MSPKCDRRARARVAQHLSRILRASALTGAVLGVGGAKCPGYTEGPQQPRICEKYVEPQVDASWVLLDGGGLAVRAVIHGVDSYSYGYSTDIEITGGQKGAVERGAYQDVTFDFSPNPGVALVQALVTFECGGFDRRLMVSFDVSAPAPGATIAVTEIEL